MRTAKLRSDKVTPEKILFTEKFTTACKQHLSNLLIFIYSKFLKWGISPRKVEVDTLDSKGLVSHAKETLNPMGFLVRLITLLLLGTAVFLVYELQPLFDQVQTERANSPLGFVFIVVSTSLLLFKGGFFLYDLFLFFRYKVTPSVSDELLPSCSIIVPAYNEGKLVLDTLMSIADSDFPEGKMQLVAIDDGSKDDTWQWMQKAKAQLGDRLSIYQQPKNMGKRHALYRGFKLATGEVFVTIDSDSIIKKDTLRNLISPFVTDENCGAVAGNVRVLNNQRAIIPRMLSVSFVFSFEFIRSAQGSLKTVLCTPGALAAYRKDAVMSCLTEWVNQTFMGQPSDIGEDRAMTNMILKQGYHVLFQKNAHVLTNVPESYSGLYKMFIRWERSNVRENIMMSQFVFKDFREGSKFGARLLFVNQWLRILTAYPFIILMMIFILTHPVLFVSSTLLSILVLSSFPALFYARKYNIYESFWAYSYSILYTFGLFWITPYAIATASKRGWLTRELSEEDVALSNLESSVS
ncbi:glycosyltransferase family 2 protein [Reichenbachiella agarivorans]|uniref:N-acetylglucosaminyltransferase n=1 Tax=Reichenbachiella agarivorans TaxID=2979464 RepID=A0ABY6CPV0_9BACT|nr:glycosyltransferase family 2 protein [Reichenbachiella agarivorans]UXP32555.1 glycosyltransferase family 2 protein [Reichenbachiella agarivorans]